GRLPPLGGRPPGGTEPLALAVHLYGWPPGGCGGGDGGGDGDGSGDGSGDGGGPPRAGLPYRIFVGLTLNAPKVHALRAAAAYRGIKAALPGSGGPDGRMAEALAGME